MGYVYRCPKCGTVVEEGERSDFRDALSRHFKDNHPNMNDSGYNLPDFG
jgi:transcription initiation factor IIE alpha subunit